jgi:hypothetical protein
MTEQELLAGTPFWYGHTQPKRINQGDRVFNHPGCFIVMQNASPLTYVQKPHLLANNEEYIERHLLDRKGEVFCSVRSIANESDRVKPHMYCFKPGYGRILVFFSECSLTDPTNPKK